MTTAKVHLSKYFWGLAASLVTLLAGAWLMLAPFALGYQPYGAGWIDKTNNDFWFGLGILVVSLIGIVLFVASLVGHLRAVGVVRSRYEAASSGAFKAQQRGSLPSVMRPTDATQAGQQTEFEQAIAMLATTLAADLAERRKAQSADNGRQPAPTMQSAGGENA